MSCDLALLQDLVDGELEGEAKAEVERHSRECLVCRRELMDLRSLLAEARSLPESIEPGRDLWPEIETGLERGGKRRIFSGPARRRRRVAHPLYWAAAALAALALAWPLATRLGNQEASPAPSRIETATVPASGTASEALLAAADQARSEDGVLRTHRDLLEVLAVRQGDLEPETLATVKENLRLIDEAIGEIRSALAENPGNRQLSLLLASQYRQEVNVLRQINRT